MTRSRNARRIPKDGHEWEYRDHHIDWAGVHEALRKQRKETVVGWFWLQRRDFKRMRPGEIRKRLGLTKDQLQVIQAESDDYPLDYTPTEWFTLDEVRLKRNLVQVERQKKALGEIPRWDTWIRLTPPEKPSLRQHSIVNDLVRARKGEQNLANEYKRLSALGPIGREREEARELPKYMRMAEEARLDRLEGKREVYYRLNHRWGKDGLDEWKRKRATALHKARAERYAEQVKRMNEARAAKRKGLR